MRDRGGIDEMNQGLWDVVNRVAKRKIGRVRQGRGRNPCKRWWNEDIKKGRKERKKLTRTRRRLKTTNKWE